MKRYYRYPICLNHQNAHNHPNPTTFDTKTCSMLIDTCCGFNEIIILKFVMRIISVKHMVQCQTARYFHLICSLKYSKSTRKTQNTWPNNGSKPHKTRKPAR